MFKLAEDRRGRAVDGQEGSQSQFGHGDCASEVRQRGQELKLASIGATTQRDGEAEVIRRRCSRAIGDEFLQLANERLEPVVGIPNCLRLERVDEL
jgi:hypothetical protein